MDTYLQHGIVLFTSFGHLQLHQLPGNEILFVRLWLLQLSNYVVPFNIEWIKCFKLTLKQDKIWLSISL